MSKTKAKLGRSRMYMIMKMNNLVIKKIAAQLFCYICCIETS